MYNNVKKIRKIKIEIFFLSIFIFFSCSSILNNSTLFKLNYIKKSLESFIGNIDENASIGIKIVSLKSKKVLFEKNSKKLLTPASNTKLLTYASAIELLDLSYNFKTVIQSYNKNIILTGSGDPTLKSEDLDSLALIINQSFSEIDTLFINTKKMDDLEYGTGWMWDEGSEEYSAPINTLIVNKNCVTFEYSADKIGKPARLNYTPYSNQIIINNQSITVDDTTDFLKLQIERDWVKQTNTFDISGEILINSPNDTLTKNIYNPNLFNANLFANHLSLHGSTVNNIVFTKIFNLPYDTLAFHESKKINVIGEKMMNESDNQIAEVFLKTLGFKFQKEGSSSKGIRTLKTFLHNKAMIDTNFLHIQDGSGLSRYNLLNVDQIISLLVYMNESPYRQQFKNSLPFGGKRGSRLEGRLVYAGNKIRAKTGSLSGVSALSGYIESNSLGPLAFSIIINGFTGSSDPFRKLQDDICKFLVMN